MGAYSVIYISNICTIFEFGGEACLNNQALTV